MKLQRHQMEVAVHLAARCKDQKGMLVYHGMGTGKTLTALIFAMTFPNHDVVIVTPKEIQFTWKSEVKQLKLHRRFLWHTYNDLEKLKGKVRGAIVILDEAHNFIDQLDDLRLHLIDEMRHSFKILLLTGTPISSAYSGWQELVILMNLAAGKEVLPHNITVFNRKYMLIDKQKALTWGYLEPIIRHYQWIWILYLQTGRRLVTNTLFSFVSIPQRLKAILQMIGLMRRASTPVIEQEIIEKTIWEEVQSEVFKLLDPVHVLKDYLSYQVQKNIDRVVFGGLIAYYYRKQRLGFRDIHSLDIPRLSADIAPYISFYDIGHDSAYPAVSHHVESVPYDAVQHALLVKLQSGLADISDIKSLRKTDNEAEAGYYSNIGEKAFGRYWDACRRISGLCFPERQYFAPKFKRLLDIIDKKASKRSVVYSEFHSTFEYLQLYLKFIERPHHVLDIHMTARRRSQVLRLFETGRVALLLLHPSMTEGISIKGATQMHILEPQAKIHTSHQVAARVVRFMSHSHLPEQERHVDIYVWQAVLSNDAIQAVRASIVQTKESLKQWWASNREVVPPIPILLPQKPFQAVTNRFQKPATDMTEEEDLLEATFRMDRMLEKFSGHLKTTKLPTGPVDCCVWNPDEVETKECLEHKPTCFSLYPQ